MSALYYKVAGFVLLHWATRTWSVATRPSGHKQVLLGFVIVIISLQDNIVFQSKTDHPRVTLIQP